MKLKILLIFLLTLLYIHCKQPEEKLNTKNNIDIYNPKVEIDKLKEQNIEIQFYGKIDLLNSQKDSVKNFYGGDCSGSRTRYKIHDKYFTIDTISCGEYGDTYTKYLLSSANSIELIFKEEITFIKGGKIINKFLINFMNQPVVAKSETDTVYLNKNKKSFKSDTINNIQTSYEYWNLNYNKVWTYNNLKE